MPPSVRVALTMTQCWHRVPGGQATSVTRLAAELARRDDVVLHAVGPRSRRRPAPWPDGLPAQALPLPLPILYDSWTRTGRPSVESASGPVDVVHLTVPIAPASGRAPLVATVHDVLPLTHPRGFTRRGAGLMRAGLARIRDEASLVAVPSRIVAEDCRRFGFDPGRLEVVPWGADTVAVDEAEVERVRRLYDVTGDYVLFVGTVEPRKGLATLLDAMRSLDRPALTLVVVGPKGWGDDPVAGSPPPPGPVVRTGHVPHDDLAPLRHGAAVCCVPSVAEGFGLPALEALAAGAPLVTSAATASAEVAGDAAVTFPAGDAAALATALGNVLDDHELAEQLRVRARRRAAEFSWEDTARRTVELYRRAIEESS